MLMLMIMIMMMIVPWCSLGALSVYACPRRTEHNTVISFADGWGKPESDYWRPQATTRFPPGVSWTRSRAFGSKPGSEIFSSR